jgi:hypothetical protein
MTNLLIHVKREIATSPEIAWEVAQDYTHFIFAHRKNFAAFEVLFDDGELQAFYYVSKPLPFLPVGRRFISARKLDHERMSLNQVYKSVDGRQQDRISFHFQVNPKKDGRVEWEGLYLWPVSGLASAFPGVLTRLFAARVRRIWREDEELMTCRSAPERAPGVCVPYQNPVLAEELTRDLPSIEALISKRDAADTRYFEFPHR